MRSVKRGVRRALRRFDRDISRFSASPAGRRLRILELAGVDLVLDVGANAGQYGAALRESGFRGRIVSFEPQPEVFARLFELASGDPAWTCQNIALGDREGSAELGVGKLSRMSSLLPLRPSLDSGARITVPVRRLDAIARDVLRPDDRPLLKIDTEGYELEVLRGAGAVLRQVRVVEAELLLEPIYEGQPRLDAVIDHLASEGFRLADLVPGYFHWETGRLTYADGIFTRDG